MLAVVDEAMVHRGRPAYLLAAVLLPDDRRSPVRSAAQRVAPRRRRFHFHQEQDREKGAMMRLVADEAVAMYVLMVCPCPGPRREHARRRMLLELADRVARHGAVELCIESRGPHNDRLDRMAFIEARRDNLLSENVLYTHRQAHEEPLLWLADGLAGAARAGLLLRDHTWLRLLPRGLLTVRRLAV